MFFAYLTKALDVKGCLTGAIMGLILLAFQDFRWLLTLLIFFTIGVAATMYGKKTKRKMGYFQKTRTFENVVSNGGVAILFSTIGPVGLFGFVGSLAAATSDTLSSEIGVLSKKEPFLITNFKRVRAGTDGAISFLGTAASVLGAILFGIICMFIFSEPILLSVSILCGIFGSLIDSVVGATLERRGYFKNWTTNLTATVFGALFGSLILVISWI
ncbi:MAG: DUF92 domain-containing protein [archaeon]